MDIMIRLRVKCWNTRELDGKGMNRAKVHIAAGLPLTWVATQKEDFQKYLLQNESVDFIFRNKEYHVEFAGAGASKSSSENIYAHHNPKVCFNEQVLPIETAVYACVAMDWK